MDIHEGQRWQVKEELSTTGLTHWRAPLTTAFSCVVPAGTILVVVHDPRPSATAISCRPEHYAELEPNLVPAEDSESAKYDGYTLVLSLDAFGDGRVVQAERP